MSATEAKQTPEICDICGGTMSVGTPALKFLHEQVHSEPWGRPHGLGQLPYVLFNRIGTLMADFAAADNARIEQQVAQLRAACEAALAHIEELRDAWMRGIIDERDGRGGTRSNRNVDVETQLRAALAASEPQGEAT